MKAKDLRDIHTVDEFLLEFGGNQKILKDLLRIAMVLTATKIVPEPWGEANEAWVRAKKFLGDNIPDDRGLFKESYE